MKANQTLIHRPVHRCVAYPFEGRGSPQKLNECKLRRPFLAWKASPNAAVFTNAKAAQQVPTHKLDQAANIHKKLCTDTLPTCANNRMQYANGAAQSTLRLNHQQLSCPTTMRTTKCSAPTVQLSQRHGSISSSSAACSSAACSWRHKLCEQPSSWHTPRTLAYASTLAYTVNFGIPQHFGIHQDFGMHQHFGIRQHFCIHQSCTSSTSAARTVKSTPDFFDLQNYDPEKSRSGRKLRSGTNRDYNVIPDAKNLRIVIL